MSTSGDFQSRLAQITLAMENEEWGKAIHDLENIGTIPEKFVPVASSILFYLYLTRNQFEKLAKLAPQFNPSRSKDCMGALLLYRDRALDYPVELPAHWDLDVWEKATEEHVRAGRLEPKELPLCVHFLSALNRPRLLEMLHALAIEAGAPLDTESVETILRCYLASGWFAQARHFLWENNLNNIPFERLSFAINRAEKGTMEIPASDDKFLAFLRDKFGGTLPPTMGHRSAEPG